MTPLICPKDKAVIIVFYPIKAGSPLFYLKRNIYCKTFPNTDFSLFNFFFKLYYYYIYLIGVLFIAVGHCVYDKK